MTAQERQTNVPPPFAEYYEHGYEQGFEAGYAERQKDVNLENLAIGAVSGAVASGLLFMLVVGPWLAGR